MMKIDENTVIDPGIGTRVIYKNDVYVIVQDSETTGCEQCAARHLHEVKMCWLCGDNLHFEKESENEGE